MIEHTIRAFDKDLRQVGGKIVEMARLDAKQIDDAIEALIKRDIALAKRVISTDERVDELQREIEEKAVATIARRQPMAVDLRELVGALRIANDLERVGDLAENIAKRALLLTAEIQVNEVVFQLQHMVDLVRDRLAQVVQCYEQGDVAAVLDIWRMDQEIDALNSGLFRELLTFMMEDPRTITFCTHMLFCAKNIERVGDQSPTSPRPSIMSWRDVKSPGSVPKRILLAGKLCR